MKDGPNSPQQDTPLPRCLGPDAANRLLLLAQDDAGAVQLDLVDTDLEALVRDALDRFQPVLARTGIVVDVEVGGPVVAPVDRAAYRRIVENLVENERTRAAAGRRAAPGSACRSSERSPTPMAATSPLRTGSEGVRSWPSASDCCRKVGRRSAWRPDGESSATASSAPGALGPMKPPSWA